LASPAPELELLYTNEKSGETLVLYRLKLSPAASYALIEDGTNYANSTLKGTVLLDPTAATDEDLGQYGRLTVAA